MFRRLLCLSALLVFFVSHTQERIKSFDSNIIVDTNGSLSVTENIEVVVTNRQIRHGILREFPTFYKDRLGTFYRVRFEIKNVLLDDNPVPYTVKEVSNGVKIYIGDNHHWVSRGDHTYTIEYQTNRQIGYFDQHDELYWNVTGNGWRFAIDKVTARVVLPIGIPIDRIKETAYTGSQGMRGRNYNSYVTRNGVIKFESTKKLHPHEGMTIVVGWPKGFITPPSKLQEWKWFFSDNKHVLLYLIWLLILMFLCFRVARKNRKRKGDKPIIPLFYPPKDMTPGEMRYINIHGYDNKIFASDVVAMAVDGWLTIDHKKGILWSKGTYTLIKKKKETNPKIFVCLFDRFFKLKDRIQLGKNDSVITSCADLLEGYYKIERQSLFNFHEAFFIIIAMISLIVTVFVNILSHTERVWLFIPAISYTFIIYTAYRLLRSYTKKGFEIKREIDGFKLFLSTTETERLKIIGTPPTRTPELYETYLPYAIALGVELAWSAQFAPLFKKLEAAGIPYIPIWISGGRHDSFNASNFASNVSKSMSSAISSASSRPGSSSGFGGRGSSGGGGGGGGGGGW